MSNWDSVFRGLTAFDREPFDEPEVGETEKYRDKFGKERQRERRIKYKTPDQRTQMWIDILLVAHLRLERRAAMSKRPRPDPILDRLRRIKRNMIAYYGPLHLENRVLAEKTLDSYLCL